MRRRNGFMALGAAVIGLTGAYLCNGPPERQMPASQSVKGAYHAAPAAAHDEQPYRTPIPQETDALFTEPAERTVPAERTAPAERKTVVETLLDYCLQGAAAESGRALLPEERSYLRTVAESYITKKTRLEARARISYEGIALDHIREGLYTEQLDTCNEFFVERPVFDGYGSATIRVHEETPHGFGVVRTVTIPEGELGTYMVAEAALQEQEAAFCGKITTRMAALKDPIAPLHQRVSEMTYETNSERTARQLLDCMENERELNPALCELGEEGRRLFLIDVEDAEYRRIECVQLRMAAARRVFSRCQEQGLLPGWLKFGGFYTGDGMIEFRYTDGTQKSLRVADPLFRTYTRRWREQEVKNEELLRTRFRELLSSVVAE